METRRFLFGPYAVMSAAYFAISATTFSALGLLLAAMAPDLEWSWSAAGLGFTLLGLSVGLASPLAGWAVRTLGVRMTYAAGAAVLAAAFTVLGASSSVFVYWGALLAGGAGFALMANVPATHAIAAALPPSRRDVWIGVYLTIGAAGGIAGPWIAQGVLEAFDTWRVYWFAAAAVIGGVGAACVLSLPRRVSAQIGEGQDRAPTPWGDIFGAPAFWAASAALVLGYWVAPLVSAWLPVHVDKTPAITGFAAATLSTLYAANAVARALGGVVTRVIPASALLLSAVIAGAAGMAILPTVASRLDLLIFAGLAGYCFGMGVFAVSAFAIERFGRDNAGPVLGAMNGVGVIAVLGPVTGGGAVDAFGSLNPVFYATAIAACVIGVIILAVMGLDPAAKEKGAPRQGRAGRRHTAADKV